MGSERNELIKEQSKDTGMALVLLSLLYLFFFKEVKLVALPIVLLVINMTLPALFKYPARLWFGLSHLLGAISSRVLLTLVYVLLVVPMGLILRLLGKDFMGLSKWRDGRPSAFVHREHSFGAKDLERPF